MPINYANPQGVGATAMPGSTNDARRNAITQALMRVANPPPNTAMPQQQAGYGGMRPDLSRPPNVLGPTTPGPMDPLNAAGAMPGAQPPGLPAQAGMAPTALAPRPPGMPPPVMPPSPASGLPAGPQPNMPNLLNQAPLVTPPNSNLLPPGLNSGSGAY
jgi:hypothetical protein